MDGYQDGFHPDMMRSTGLVDSPFWVAIKGDHVETVEFLLSMEMDINNFNSPMGDTPLAIAVQNKSIPMVKLLLRHGASIHIRDHWKPTVLSAAVSGGNMQIVKMLIEAGANEDVNIESDYDYYPPPIFIATSNGQADIVKILIAAGADANKSWAYEGRTETVLEVAKGKGYQEIVRMLLSAGAVSKELPEESGSIKRRRLR
jgi:ankyrin repeat protein